MSYPYDQWEDDDHYYGRQPLEGLSRVLVGLTVALALLGVLAFGAWYLTGGDDDDDSAGAVATPTPFPTPTPRPQAFVTIPEGLTNAQLQARLQEQFPRLDPAVIQAAIENAPTPEVFGPGPFPNTEGYLFPETYAVDGDMLATDAAGSIEAIFQQMRNQFDLVAERNQLSDAPILVGYGPYDVLIIASLIEEEAQAPEDRAKIARVIYNRLEADWLLGIDATVVYALDGDRELSTADLAVDSPYNTRAVRGLPPTPIAAPGEASIQAALNPADGDWMYYVRTDEAGVGTHTFAVTEAEFNAAVQLCVERDLGC